MLCVVENIHRIAIRNDVPASVPLRKILMQLNEEREMCRPIEIPISSDGSREEAGVSAGGCPVDLVVRAHGTGHAAGHTGLE